MTDDWSTKRERGGATPAVRLGMQVYRRHTRGSLGQITELEATRFNVRTEMGATRWIALADVWRVVANRAFIGRAADSF